jgi:hypothetical protein
MQIRPEGMGIDWRFRGFVLRRRPIFGMWLKLLNVVVRMLTFGGARVVTVSDVINLKK